MKKFLTLALFFIVSICYSQRYEAEIFQGAVLPEGQKEWVIITEIYIVHVSKDGKDRKKISREYSWRDYSTQKDRDKDMKLLKQYAEEYRIEVQRKLSSFNNN